jgi:hypothetical protein
VLGGSLRLPAEQRRERVFLGVGGDDVAVGVDKHLSDYPYFLDEP